MVRKNLFLFSGIILFLSGALVFAGTNPVPVDLISGGCRLNAAIYPAAGNQPFPTLILLHGYPGGEGDPLGLGKRLSQRGINVLVFNYRGTWSSEGEFSFENSMADIGAAISFLKNDDNIRKFSTDPSAIVVGGYSYGGAMAVNAALTNPEITRIIAIGGADESVFGRKFLADPDFRQFFEAMLQETQHPEGPARFDLDESIRYWLANLDKFDLVKHAGVLKNRDILLLSGLNDHSVLLEEHTLPLYRKLRALNSEQIQLVILDADHSFRNVREKIAGILYQWIMRVQ
jgi:pimeloyl-ACP methyl ester carboxylesterase